MKKINAILCILIMVCTVFCSCRHQERYRFLNEENQISAISIILISFDETGNVVETELLKINEQESFLQDFKKVNCYTYYGDPCGVTEEGVKTKAVKIIYENGEYELINWKGQANYTIKRGFSFYSGYHVFDEKQFEALINYYLAADNLL